MMRHGFSINGYAVALSPRYFLAYDWSSGTPAICNPVRYDVLRFVLGHLSPGVMDFNNISPAQAGLILTNQAPKHMYPVPFHMVCLSLLHSHHVWFDFEWVELVHPDVIYQDTSHLCAEGLSDFTSGNI